MSIDFEIVCSDRIDSTEVLNFVATKSDLTVEHNLANAANIVLMLNTKTGPNPAMIVDGPFEVELEDVADCVLAVVLAPKWLWQISVPAGAPDKAIRVAMELCCFLAGKGRGAAFDPQDNRVFFPKHAPIRYKAVHEPEAKINEIGLQFMFPYSALTPDTGADFLAILRKYCPEAVPTRFGDFEPFQGKLLPGNDAPFITMWKEASTAPFAGRIFWKAQSPCLGGDVFFSDRREAPPNKPANCASYHHLSIAFDGRALEKDERWRDTVIALFRSLALRLKPFYAVCYLRRNILVQRNSVMFTRETEGFSFWHGPWWKGIAPVPAWMAWFGPGYAELLAKPLKASEFVQETPAGIFIKMGPDPMNRDQLAGIFPALPDELLILKTGQADLIPNLDEL